MSTHDEPRSSEMKKSGGMSDSPTREEIRQETLNFITQFMAQKVHDAWEFQHLGLFPWGGGLILVHGNDNLPADQRSNAAAKAVQEAAKLAGCEVSDIQTDTSGDTWCVGVLTEKRLEETLIKVAADTWLRESLVNSQEHETEGEANATEQNVA